MCNVRPEDRISAVELLTRLKFKSMKECLQDTKLQWFGYLEGMEKNAWSSKYRTFNISSSFLRGRGMR